MMQSHDRIGPQRYRESFGRYYDDFVVGDVYEHRPGRTITESDNTWSSRSCGDGRGKVRAN